MTGDNKLKFNDKLLDFIIELDFYKDSFTDTLLEISLRNIQRAKELAVKKDKIRLIQLLLKSYCLYDSYKIAESLLDYEMS